MKIGRNDPCPCGSGRKYKHCCLARDEEAERAAAKQREEMLREAAAFGDAFAPAPFPPAATPPAFVPPAFVPPPRAPLDLARDELFEEFEETDPADVPALFHRALAMPDLLDGEMANLLITAVRGHAGPAAADALIAELRDRAPDVYAEEEAVFLEWQFVDALAAGQTDTLEPLGLALTELVGSDLDIFLPILDRVIYHGYLPLVVEMMRRAWPDVRDSKNLFEWSIEEFGSRSRDMMIYSHLIADPELRADAPALLADLAHFPPIAPERLAEALALLQGRAERTWSLADFVFARGKKRKTSDPASANLNDLLLSFFGEQLRTNGSAALRAELAIRGFYQYTVERQAGELEDTGDFFGERPRGARRTPQRATRHPLRPDRDTYDVYAARLMDFLSERYHQVAVLVELTPAWLEFLAVRGLLTEDERRETLLELRGLLPAMASLFESRSDGALLWANVATGWERPLAELGEDLPSAASLDELLEDTGIGMEALLADFDLDDDGVDFDLDDEDDEPPIIPRAAPPPAPGRAPAGKSGAQGGSGKRRKKRRK
jgi:hypothetical protein